jgi:hypothetical protein
LVHSNNTYEAFVDGESVAKGALEDDFDHLPPKFIDKVGDTKPADWDDQEFIPDPTHVKPEGYDEVPGLLLTSNPLALSLRVTYFSRVYRGQVTSETRRLEC